MGHGILGATAREASQARQGHSSCPRAGKAQSGGSRAESLSLVGREGRTSAALARRCCGRAALPGRAPASRLLLLLSRNQPEC